MTMYFRILTSNFSLLCVSAVALFFSSCGSSPFTEDIPVVCSNNSQFENPVFVIPEDDPRRHILFFIDKSSSMGLDSTILERLSTGIEQITAHHFDTSGINIRVHLIHENPLNSSPVIDRQNTISAPVRGDLGNLEWSISINQYCTNQRKLSESIRQQIKEILTQVNDNSSQRYTDLWSSLELIRNFQTTLPSDNNQLLVVYISDMEESMAGDNRRNFSRSRNQPKNKSEAEEMAREDNTFISGLYDIEGLDLSAAEVWLWRPFDPMEGGDGFQQMFYYWKELLGSFGCKEVMAK